MTELKTLTELNSNAELRQEVIDQLNKDFGSNVPDFEWDDSVVDPFSAFVTSFEHFLKVWLREHEQKLMQILYRVDLFERKVKFVWSYDADERPRRLAFMILDRELQKVLTRRLNKQK